MKTKLILTFLIMAAALAVWSFAPPPAWCQRDIKIVPKSEIKEGRYALVIGNGAYKNRPLLPLKNPVNDAKAVTEALKACGFWVETHTDVGYEKLEKAIDSFASRLKRKDIGLFFYAGHGVQINGINFLVPVDAKIKRLPDVKYKCISANYLIDTLSYSGNHTNIVIFDACRDNPFSGKRSIRGGGLAHMDSPEGMLIAFATSPGKTADDGPGANGLYTAELLKYLTTPGISIEDMFKLVRRGVLKSSEGMQKPWELSSLTRSFYFLPGQAPAGQIGAGPGPEAETDAETAALERQRREQEEQENLETWLNDMKSDFVRAQVVEKDQSANLQVKADTWQIFIEEYGRDNPKTTEDEEMRKKAKKQLAVWNYKLYVEKLIEDEQNPGKK